MLLKPVIQSLTDDPRDRPLVPLAVVKDFLKLIGSEADGHLLAVLFLWTLWTWHKIPSCIT